MKLNLKHQLSRSVFKKQTKFESGIILRKRKFAFLPTFIDGGKYKIWLKFYYTLYKRTNNYLNWDMPDEFAPIGNFSAQGALERFNNLKYKDSNIHWEEHDDFTASFMKVVSQENTNNIQ